MPGPLPTENPRRRNQRTIPTTNLPISGRSEPAPPVPEWIELGAAGRAWWEWAWSTPQAAGWGVGAGQEAVIARRASLEDDMAALADVEGLDLLDVLDEEVASKFKAVITRLAALVGGRIALMREMREVDTKLGLTPHALAALRWKIVEVDTKPESKDDDEVAQRRAEREARLAANG